MQTTPQIPSTTPPSARDPEITATANPAMKPVAPIAAVGRRRTRSLSRVCPGIGHAAEAEPGLEVRRGVAVSELVVHTYDGVPHVSGVRTDSGQELRAELVVDAMGRRSQLPRWLAQAGIGPVHEDIEDSGYIYYTRFFRSRDGHMPEFRTPPVTRIGTFSLPTIPSDNNWSVVVVTSAGDTPPKRLRDPRLWTALLAACPRHLQHLGDVVRTHLEDRREFAQRWDAVTETELTPWYRENVEEDRLRMGEIEALRNGRETALPSTPSAVFRQALASARCVIRTRSAWPWTPGPA